ncbi:MAG: HlyC/CorC family transporter [Deltaproteobacteria bacterium]|nr:HlyC/CorC family transporter [Deltaproteobacteria bacterium]
MSIGMGLLIVLLCALSEGFFSGSEIALVSADKVKIRAMREEGSSSGRLLASFLEAPEPILTTTLIGTNLSTVTGTTVFALMLSQHWGLEGGLWTVLLLSPLLLLFGELVPKSVYRRYSSEIAPVVIRPLLFLSKVFAPAVWIVQALMVALLRALGADEENTLSVSRDELRLLLDRSETADVEEDEREMIHRIFDFPEVTVREAMKPLIDVAAIEETEPLEKALTMFVETGYSRLPVFHERIDDIVGVLRASDLLGQDDLSQPCKLLMRPVPYVPEASKVDQLLPRLQRQPPGMAIVVDEYGGAEGLVTVEDILEEIVGEIEDEHDELSIEIRRRGEREFLVSARTEVDHLNEELDVAIPAGDYETLAGFMLEQIGHIPVAGESTGTDNAVFTVVSATSRAIEEVQILLRDQDEIGVDTT